MLNRPCIGRKSHFSLQLPLNQDKAVRDNFSYDFKIYGHQSTRLLKGATASPANFDIWRIYHLSMYFCLKWSIFFNPMALTSNTHCHQHQFLIILTVHLKNIDYGVNNKLKLSLSHLNPFIVQCESILH